MKVIICLFNKNVNRSSKKECLTNILLNKIFEYYNLKISKEDIIADDNGKLFFKNYNIFFNFSYSEEIGIIGISKENLGIDIEKIKKYDEKIINKVYSKYERSFLNNCDDKNYEYTKLWTYKEAYVKYTGKGIDENFYKLNFIEDDKYINNKIFKTINYKDYVITLCSEDLNLDVEVINND